MAFDLQSGKKKDVSKWEKKIADITESLDLSWFS